jgi:hypothetical protein
MNTKGASASGKSTMRPLQHALADHMGVDWGDFALISPDIWRKQLLDYSSLGPHYKYAGAFTGEELHIVDVKLDAYMAAKAERGAMSHLLIDRFRFDSFAPASDEAGSNLLTRFGRSVHLFFMITPPAAIVERSWQRGLAVGRYKAVDDLLAHNIKAYVGMPEVFFTWARHPGKQVRYEFLDNSVPYGERPRAAAFGKDGVLNILDVGGMLDIERHRRIDVRASGPESLHTDGAAIAPERNTGFLSACARSLTEVNFADRASGRVYLRMRGGMAFARDPDILNAMLCDADTRAGILALVPRLVDTPSSVPAAPPLALEQLVGADGDQILGRWRSADQ